MFFYIFFSLTVFAKNLNPILQAQSLKELKKFTAQRKEKEFLNLLCEKQQAFGQIPWACYSISKNNSHLNFWCLNLNTAKLHKKDLVVALQKRGLSSPCKSHLQNLLKRLLYREKPPFLIKKALKATFFL